MSKNPVLQMSKARRQAWLDHAEPDDFFEMLTLLTRLYAKKNYKPGENYNSGKLLADYPEYLKRKTSKMKYTNNVPFASEGDAPGSYVETPESDDPMDEINRMIDEL